jgi:hypothetical protein
MILRPLSWPQLRRVSCPHQLFSLCTSIDQVNASLLNLTSVILGFGAKDKLQLDAKDPISCASENLVRTLSLFDLTRKAYRDQPKLTSEEIIFLGRSWEERVHLGMNLRFEMQCYKENVWIRFQKLLETEATVTWTGRLRTEVGWGYVSSLLVCQLLCVKICKGVLSNEPVWNKLRQLENDLILCVDSFDVNQFSQQQETNLAITNNAVRQHVLALSANEAHVCESLPQSSDFTMNWDLAIVDHAGKLKMSEYVVGTFRDELKWIHFVVRCSDPVDFQKGLQQRDAQKSKRFLDCFKQALSRWRLQHVFDPWMNQANLQFLHLWHTALCLGDDDNKDNNGELDFPKAQLDALVMLWTSRYSRLEKMRLMFTTLYSLAHFHSQKMMEKK